MNQAIFYFFYNFAHQSSLGDGLIIFFAKYFPFLVIVAAALFLFFYHKRWREVVVAISSGAVAWFVAKFLKIIIHTPRPFDAWPGVESLVAENGYAFPSGHATFMMALAVSIFFSHKKAGYIFMFFALIIGLARVAAGVHTPVDILGGFVLGFLIAYLLKNV
jgi:undecaprenyl-diphosphatase